MDSLCKRVNEICLLAILGAVEVPGTVVVVLGVAVVVL